MICPKGEQKMYSYKMNIAGCERNLPICPINDKLSIGAFVIFGDPELTTAVSKALLDKAPEYDYLISAEAKGIPLVHEMARLAGNQKYFLARKAPKLYMTGVFEVTVRSITTAKEQKLYLDTADAELMKGKRILIVDDVISTGESLRAIEELIGRAGGKICGKMTILAEGDAIDRDDIVYLEPLPLFDTSSGKPVIIGKGDGEVVED
jgi:adenine phosphoribosyltransferase